MENDFIFFAWSSSSWSDNLDSSFSVNSDSSFCFIFFNVFVKLIEARPSYDSHQHANIGNHSQLLRLTLKTHAYRQQVAVPGNSNRWIFSIEPVAIRQLSVVGETRDDDPKTDVCQIGQQTEKLPELLDRLPVHGVVIGQFDRQKFETS